MALLRRRLTCFYCGSRSAQVRDPSLEKFQCKSCEAVNYLDKNGNITDPPSQPTPPPVGPVTYKRPSVSPTLTSKSAVSFCRTCQLNQHLVREILSNYLPEESDPRYKDYVDNLGSYRETLERKYPQCCSDCWSMAADRMLDSAKYARTDHLKKMVERTRRIGPSQSRLPSWKRFFLFVGQLGWWSSLLLFVFWHGVVAITVPENGFDEFAMDRDAPVESSIARFVTCARDVYQTRQLHAACAPDLSGWLRYGLVLGCLTIWWSPVMKTLQRRKTHRPVGQKTFYSAQIISLAVRALTIYSATSGMPLPMRFSVEAQRALHGVALGFLILLTWISRKSLRLERLPPIQFTLESESILPGIPRPQPHPKRPLFEKEEIQRVNIDDFAPQPPERYPSRHGRTPPPEQRIDDDTSEMDWTPIPSSSITTLTSVSQRPLSQLYHPSLHSPGSNQSPFNTHVPPSPFSPNAGSFRQGSPFDDPRTPTPLTKTPQSGFTGQRSFINGFGATNVTASSKIPAFAQGRGILKELPADQQVSLNDKSKAPRHQIEIRDPTFYPPQDYQVTGLEDAFSAKSFGLQENKLESSRKSGWGWLGRG